MRTSEVFLNNGHYYQTNKKSKEDLLSTSSTPAKTVLEFNNRFMNNGKFVYDYGSAEYTPAFSAVSQIIVNKGSMWFVVGARHEEPAPDPKVAVNIANVAFYVTSSFRNFGYIQVSGARSHLASFHIRKLIEPITGPAKAFIVNRGQIRLEKASWALRDNIRGGGCISITDGAELILNGSIKYHNRQKICFDPHTENATLHIEVHREVRPFSRKLHGFSKNCVIKFNETMRKFEYRGSDLLFWTKKEEWAFKFNIGPNYDVSQFLWADDAIVYNGNITKTVPAKCRAKDR